MTIGVLGSEIEPANLDFGSWVDLRFGTDTLDDVLRHLSAARLDVLIVEGNVTYLTADVVALVPDRVGRILIVATTDANAAWAESFDKVTVVRSLHEVGRALAPVEETAVDALRGRPPVIGDRRGRVVAVWGPVGAPGITTTAISLATVSARSGDAVLLCDADTRGAAIAIALAIADEVPGLAAACRLASRGELTVDELFRLAVTTTHSSAPMSVLTGLPRASRWATIEPAKIRDVIELARRHFDLIVIDTGFGIEENEWVDDAPQRDGAAREILRGADTVVAVGHSDAVGIARLIRALDDLSEIRRDPVIILNETTGGSARDAIDALHRFTEHTVRATIPRDSRGGVEESAGRATNSAVWRRVAHQVGLRDDSAMSRGRARR